jgi:8-oxo-dGTP pyrophosphatase MutT (NUDIX family)
VGGGSFADHLRKKLRFAIPEKGHPSEKEAAVLVPFLETEGQWSLVFTKRTEDLSRHKGEISFPGGMIDRDEDSLDAALRETHEELGVEGVGVEVVGAISGVHTVVSGVFIEPWVGILRDRNFTPNQHEIAEVIEIPYKALADPSVYREQRFIRRGAMYISPAYDIGPHIIWGATARIVENLLLALR